MLCSVARIFVVLLLVTSSAALTSPTPVARLVSKQRIITLQLSDNDENDVTTGVVELGDNDDSLTTSSTEQKAVAPFLSQGEIADDVLNPDLSDPKQTRVIIYIILSLLPVLFLIPLILGSRDLIPIENLPPVQL
jgi:hypothetical protein